MLDIAFIREHPDLVKDVARRRKTAVDVDALLALDNQLRATRRRADELHPDWYDRRWHEVQADAASI